MNVQLYLVLCFISFAIWGGWWVATVLFSGAQYNAETGNITPDWEALFVFALVVLTGSMLFHGSPFLKEAVLLTSGLTLVGTALGIFMHKAIHQDYLDGRICLVLIGLTSAILTLLLGVVLLGTILLYHGFLNAVFVVIAIVVIGALPFFHVLELSKLQYQAVNNNKGALARAQDWVRRVSAGWIILLIVIGFLS